MANVIVDGEGLVEQDSIRLQGFDQPRKERTMEIETDDNDIIGVWWKLRPFLGGPFEIDMVYRHLCEVPLPDRRGKFRKIICVTIDRLDLESMAGQIQRVAPASTGHV